jgi:hypothetical protein
MARALRFLSSLAAVLILGAAPAAFGQAGTTMKIVASGNCAAVSCTATSPAQFCLQGTLLHVCNGGTGFFTLITPAVPGSTTQILFNDAGAFAADGGLTYDKTLDVLAVAGALAVASGGEVRLEGTGGDTKFTRSLSAQSLDSYIDGTLGWSLNGGMLQPPACPAPIAASGVCSLNGRFMFRDTSGTYALTGVQVVQ